MVLWKRHRIQGGKRCKKRIVLKVIAKRVCMESWKKACTASVDILILLASRMSITALAGNEYP